jgi:hypothetical protein
MNNKQTISYIPLFLIILFIISVLLAFVVIDLYFYQFKTIFSVGQDAWGQFGDYIGGLLNPLFSFTALCALFYTIKLQSKELHESTEQLKNSAAALALQNDVLTRQRFETTFFQLFQLFNQLIKDMADNNNHGKKTIAYFYTCIADSNIDSIKTQLQKNQALSAYFRTLYSIIKFIDASSLLFEDKKFYSNLVRAQLSREELALLFYSCLLMPQYEQSKFIPLIIRYDLIEYLSDDTLANPAHRALWLDLIKHYSLTNL